MFLEKHHSINLNLYYKYLESVHWCLIYILVSTLLIHVYFCLGRGAEVVINVTTSKQPEKQLASKILESLEDTQVGT